MWLTGTRIIEPLRLTASVIARDGDTIMGMVIHGKGARDRMFPVRFHDRELFPEIAVVLAELVRLHPTGKLFAWNNPAHPQQHWKAAKLVCGITDASKTIKTLRTTRRWYWLNIQKLPRDLVNQLLGHSDAVAVSYYDMQRAMEEMADAADTYMRVVKSKQ